MYFIFLKILKDTVHFRDNHLLLNAHRLFLHLPRLAPRPPPQINIFYLNLIEPPGHLTTRLSFTSVCMDLQLSKAFEDAIAERTRALEVAADD